MNEWPMDVEDDVVDDGCVVGNGQGHSEFHIAKYESSAIKLEEITNDMWTKSAGLLPPAEEAVPVAMVYLTSTSTGHGLEEGRYVPDGAAFCLPPVSSGLRTAQSNKKKLYITSRRLHNYWVGKKKLATSSDPQHLHN